VWLAIALAGALYLADLTGMGMYGPDEPRYADIGRTMAQTGDLITPRLWGAAWFEKPALLYWMTAAGFRLGLGPDLAPRLPVAILSLLFLGFYWWRLRHGEGARAAACATAMLATSAGWLAYSHVAVTDVPMAVFFSVAVLLSLSWVARGERREVTAAAGCLGLAVLAKGLVPLVLFVPVLAMPLFAGQWRRVGDWFRPRPLLLFLAIVLPWYALCTMRNGTEFLRVFFVEQQFSRFNSAALQHGQPWWFYIPAFLVLLFPWSPLLVNLRIYKDPGIRALAAVVVWGLLFFSLAVNKLYGYLIPLLPATFALFGIALSRMKRPAIALVAPAMLVAVLPVLSGMLPIAFASHKVKLAEIPWMQTAGLLLAAGLLATMLARYAARRAFGAVAALAAIGFLWFQFAGFPVFDRLASARPVWLRDRPICVPEGPRDLLYGLYYYSGRQLPRCPILDPGGTQVVR
jgi:4-amino-4-deoxy-L-arabinose transferase-like glycosyltransferase